MSGRPIRYFVGAVIAEKGKKVDEITHLECLFFENTQHNSLVILYTYINSSVIL